MTDTKKPQPTPTKKPPSFPTRDSESPKKGEWGGPLKKQDK